jgi:hypothetical protein
MKTKARGTSQFKGTGLPRSISKKSIMAWSHWTAIKRSMNITWKKNKKKCDKNHKQEEHHNLKQLG